MPVRTTLRQVERRPTEVRTPGPRIAGVRRLVVVRDDRLGDVVVSLPALVSIRRTYPEARLAFMVRPEYLPLASRVEGVDEVLEASADPERLQAVLRGFNADLVVCISRSPGVAWAAARARIPHRVGTGRRVFSPLFTRRVVESRRAGNRHEVEYALSFAHRVGAAAGEAQFPVSPSSEAEQWVARWLRPDARRELVVLHPGTGGSCPGWPAENFLALAELVGARGIRTVLSIGPEDDAVVRARERGPSSADTAEVFRGGLDPLIALLRRASLVVSNSTGPLHLAAALGAPTLAFHAPWESCGVSRWGPYAQNGWGLEVSSPVRHGWSHAERRRRGAHLLSLVPPDEVARHVQDLLRFKGD